MKNINIENNTEYVYAAGLYQATSFLVNRSEVVEELLICEDIKDEFGTVFLEKYAENKNIKVRTVSKDEMPIIDNKYYIVKIRKYNDTINPNKPHIIFDNALKPGNIGNIIRSSVAFGIVDIVFIHPLFDPFSQKCLRSSMNSFAKAHIQVFDDINEYRKLFPNHRLYLFMVDAYNTLDEVIQQDIPDKYSLVFGNEIRGLPKEYKSLGQSVVIPMRNNIDSINVVTSAGIALYEFTNKTYNKK